MQHGGHGADVLGELVDQGPVGLGEFGIALHHLGADDPEIRGAQVGVHTGLAAQGLFHLVLGLAAEAVVNEGVYRQRTAPVQAHGALVLHIEHIHHTPLFVSGHGYAAAQMTDHQVGLLVFLAQETGGLAANGLLIQGVELTQAAEGRKARVVGHLGHLVHTDGVHKKGGDAHHVADAAGQVSAQVRGVLAIGGLLHIPHHRVADGVGAGGDGPIQPAPAADGVKIREAEAALGHSVQNGLLPEVGLVDDPVEPVQLLGGVVDAFFEDLIVLVEHGDLGGGGAGVDDKNLQSLILPCFFLAGRCKNTECFTE